VTLKEKEGLVKSHRDKFNLTLQGLAKSGRQWNECVTLAELADGSFADLDTKSPLFGDMQWQGELLPLGDLFVLTGSWKMNIPRKCGRCTVDFASTMSGEVDVAYRIDSANEEIEQAELQLSGDEAESLVSGELNVLDVLREHFWLAWQPLAVCSEDCKGLCLLCGVDLNKGSCDCHKKSKENVFAALKDFKFDA